MLHQYQILSGNYSSDFVQNFAEKNKYCCVVQMHGSEHMQHFWWFRSDAVIFQLFKVFSLRLQHIWRNYRANIQDQLIENPTTGSADVILSVQNNVFHVQISDCYFMCLWFVWKQSDKNHSVHGCLFLPVNFQHFFQCVMTVSWNQPQPGCWNYVYYIFIHSCTYTTHFK